MIDDTAKINCRWSSGDCPWRDSCATIGCTEVERIAADVLNRMFKTNEKTLASKLGDTVLANDELHAIVSTNGYYERLAQALIDSNGETKLSVAAAIAEKILAQGDSSANREGLAQLKLRGKSTMGKSVNDSAMQLGVNLLGEYIEAYNAHPNAAHDLSGTGAAHVAGLFAVYERGKVMGFNEALGVDIEE